MRLQEHETVQERELGEKRTVHPQNPNAPTRKTFAIGLGLTVLIGIVATILAPLPGLAIMGSLTVALLLGLAWRSVMDYPKPMQEE